MNRAHEYAPRVSALFMLSYAAMIYSIDCQHHSNKKVAEIAAYTRKALKRYFESIDVRIRHDIVHKYFPFIDDEIGSQILKVYGDELENIDRIKMEVYCVAVELAAREVLKYRDVMRSWFVDETINASKAVRWCFNSVWVEASVEGRKVFDAVLKYNLDEYAAHKPI